MRLYRYIVSRTPDGPGHACHDGDYQAAYSQAKADKCFVLEETFDLVSTEIVADYRPGEEAEEEAQLRVIRDVVLGCHPPAEGLPSQYLPRLLRERAEMTDNDHEADMANRLADVLEGKTDG